jgi:hypothetical protein
MLQSGLLSHDRSAGEKLYAGMGKGVHIRTSLLPEPYFSSFHRALTLASEAEAVRTEIHRAEIGFGGRSPSSLLHSSQHRRVS